MIRFFISIILLTCFKGPKRLFKALYEHLREFFAFDLDPIKYCESLEQIEQIKQKYRSRGYALLPWAKISVHFVPPAAVMVYYHLDNFYYIFIVYGGYNATGMPEVILHRSTQEIFWDLMDMVLIAGTSQAAVINVYLTFKPNIEVNNFMFAVLNKSTGKRRIYFKGKFWKQSKSDQLLKRHSLLRRFYSTVMVSVFWQLYLYYVLHHLLKGNLLIPRNIWLTVYMHFWTVYVSFNVNTAFYFHITATTLQFKQQCKINKINGLLSEMSLVAGGKHPNKNLLQLRSIIWNKFCTCQRKIIALSRELSQCNRFWSLILTVYIFGYVVMICYLAYAILQSSVNTLIKKSLQIFFSIQFLASVLLITSAYAVIVRNSIAIYKTNRQFVFQFSATLQPTKLQLLKLSKLISNFKGTRIGFRYINGSIIDSRMFEIIFLSMSVLYMKIFKKKIFGEDYIG